MKRLLRSRWAIVTAIVLVLGTSGAWLMARTRAPEDTAVSTRVKRGNFVVTVTSSGELRAPKFVKITGPLNAQEAEQYSPIKISQLVDEGTMVKEGDQVATLDRSAIAQKLTDVDLLMTKADADRESASLDSALNLSKAREDMRTAALTLEEKKLAKDQSQFEAPSVKRLAEIDYDKALRALRQDSVDLNTKTEQAVAKMKGIDADLSRQRNKLQLIRDVMAAYTIKAPAAGMVVYIRDWQGKKIATGSTVSPWEPSVATLPDLSVMESVTYVNEIDVRKLAKGQPVVLTLDADPTRKLKGTVTDVANSGEQRPNSDAKVFEVLVNVEHPDTTLRPGMTTGNSVQTYSASNVLHVPLEAVLSEQGVPYVYHRNGGTITKQEVERGAMNDDEVVIVRGLKENDEVLLSPPADKAKYQLVRLPGSKVPSGDSAPAAPKLPAPSAAPHDSTPVTSAPGAAQAASPAGG